VALHDAVSTLMQKGLVKENPLRDSVAAISVGIHQGTPVLDLDYLEDSDCDTDMNVVMLGSGHFVEVQGTAEGHPFSREEMDALLELAKHGISQLSDLQRKALAQ
jgi:ribonuclease PH